MKEPPVYVYVVTSGSLKWIEVFGTRQRARNWVRDMDAKYPGLEPMKVKRAKLTILG